MSSKFMVALLLGCCSLLQAKSQQFNFRFSDKEYNMYNSFANAVPAAKGNIVLQLRNEGFGWIPPSTRVEASLLLVNDKMEIVQQSNIDLQVKNRFIELKGLYRAGGKTVLVYAYKAERKDKNCTIAAIHIDENTLKADNETTLGQFETLSGSELPDYTFEYRMDSSGYFLFIQPVQKGKEAKRFEYAFFNSSLKKTGGNSIELPYESRYVTIQSAILDTEDNVLVEYRHYEKEISPAVNMNEDVKTYAYEAVLLQIEAGTNKSAEIPFNGIGYPLHSAKIVINPVSKKLSIAGTYRHSGKGKLKGVFFCDYDAKTKSITNLKTADFPDNLVELCEKDQVASTSSKNPGLSGNFKAERLSVRSNGSIDFSLEFNSTEEGYSFVNNKSYYYSQKFSKDIVNINFNKEGAVIFTRIPKNQLSGTRNFLSSFSFYYGKNLLFLYADHPKNEERDINKAPERISGPYRKSVLMLAKIDEKGDLERRAIFNHDDDDFVIIPGSIKPMAPGVFFVAQKKIGSFIEIEHTKFGSMTVK